ncbi:putative reverse transcriptase domain-containing protein [Tanacetum coccineum]
MVHPLHDERAAENKTPEDDVYCNETVLRCSWKSLIVRHGDNQHLNALWSITVENLLPPRLQYQKPPYALPEALLALVIHDDPRDPYVATRDAATAPATDNDDSPTQKETSPSEPQGSPPQSGTKGMSQSCNRATKHRGSKLIVEAEASRQCNPMVFHGHEGAVKLSRWFEKTEMVFGISECAEARKVATRGLKAANQIGWTEMRRLMTKEFSPIEEIQRMEHELWNLKVKDFDLTAYTKRFHELAQLCPEMVPIECKKIEAYIRGLTDNIKGTVIGSKPTSLNEAVHMAHALMEQKAQA